MGVFTKSLTTIYNGRSYSRVPLPADREVMTRLGVLDGRRSQGRTTIQLTLEKESLCPVT
jgi:hypothetical protein